MAMMRGQYADRVREQIGQYSRTENIYSKTADIHLYFQKQYIQPKLLALFNSANHVQFYADEIMRRMSMTGNRAILSLGSGASQVEIDVCRALKKRGLGSFQFECVELPEAQIARGRRNAVEADLDTHFKFTQADLNFWTPAKQYACLMCHHALHHVQELEHLFTAVMQGLDPRGSFVMMDMIGRNGHMRWPEVLQLIERIWEFLPNEKKIHRVLRVQDECYINRDYSVKGFEGIRSQDILPLMIAQGFGFEKFLAWGGITEVFTAFYGGNYDAGNKMDRAFIDFLYFINEILINIGYMKPTIMAAIVVADPTVSPQVYKHWTPEFCMRLPNSSG